MRSLGLEYFIFPDVLSACVPPTVPLCREKRGMRCEFPGRGVGSSQLVLGQKHPKRVNSWEAVRTGLPCPWLQVLLGCAGCSHRNKTQLNPRTEQARKAFAALRNAAGSSRGYPGRRFSGLFALSSAPAGADPARVVSRRSPT